MAESRTWPALEIRSADVDTTGDLGGVLSAVLTDFQPLAIQDLIPPPLPPGGLWDPTAPPPPEPPPTAIAWRVCFGDAATRDAAHAAVDAQDLAGVATTAVDLPDDDWVARSQASLTAVHAGRFIVAPPWDLPAAPPAGVSVIVIEPSMGFGTGHHQTTRLCLGAMSTLDLAGRDVLDLGTGSGVLAMAASLLGARTVVGVDIDADAIAAAERSAALNVLPTPVTFETADVFVTPPAPAAVVLANLTGAMLIRSAAAIAAFTAPGGTLVISGFMAYERQGVESALDAFDVTARSQEDEWCAAVLRRR